MRWLLFASIFAAFLPAQDQKCRLEGQVLSIAGAPLKKAALRMQFQGQQNQSTTPTNYSATSDNNGKFLFEDVAPGKYVLSAQRTGYINQSYGAKPGAGGSPLTLDAGQTMKDLVFKMIPQAIIFGKVVDEDGDPLPNFSVQVSRWTFMNGKKQLQMGGNSNSQADGTFVLGNLRAGRYYLSADSHANNQSFFGVEKPGSRKAQESYLKTFFPNALDASSAAMVDVAEGAEIKGMEIRVRRGVVYEVRGRIETSASAPRYAFLILLPKGSPVNSFLDQRQAQVQGKDGIFQFRNVPPGTYVLQSQFAQLETRDSTGEFTKTTPLVARLEITVADQSIENLVVPLIPGPEIRGVFKTEGTDPASQTPGAKAHPTIQFRNIGEAVNGGYAGYAEAKDDGTFKMENVTPSVVRVTVINLPDNSYVKAINFGGQDVKDKDLDLTSGGGGELQILVSANGAEVTGIVRDVEGKAVPSMIVQLCDKNGEVAKTANTDQNGAFDFKGLAPGEYKAFSWADRADGAITDPDFRKAFESKATAVKLMEKGHENIEPVLIPKDAIEVEAAKIR